MIELAARRVETFLEGAARPLRAPQIAKATDLRTEEAYQALVHLYDLGLAVMVRENSAAHDHGKFGWEAAR